MKGKLERHKLIIRLVKDNRVSNQEELSSLLEKEGLYVAQATLSRDVRELRITKVHDAGGYHYRLPRTGYHFASADSVAGGSIVSVEVSGNMAVIKTKPGHAAMIASVIDEGDLSQVMGTLAGDDTVLVILRSGSVEDEVFSALSDLFRGLAGKRMI